MLPICDEYGIKLILRPVATPHYGGHIKRLIGTIMGRVHLLRVRPGRIRRTREPTQPSLSRS